MDQYIDPIRNILNDLMARAGTLDWSVLDTLRDMAPRDWGFVSAILFGLVIAIRLVRIVAHRDPLPMDPHAKQEFDEWGEPRSTAPAKPRRGVAAAAAARREAELAALARKTETEQRRPARPAEPVREAAPAPARAPAAAPALAPVAAPVAAQAPAPTPASVAPATEGPSPAEVARALGNVRFQGQSMMKWQEYCLLRDVEGLLGRLSKGHRLFCHVALSEFFTPEAKQRTAALSDAVARALSPHRADFLIVDRQGYPAMGLAFGANDPVTRTVFQQAGLPFLRVDEDYSWPDLEAVLTENLSGAGRTLRQTA